MRSGNLFIKAVIVERDGGFYIQLRNRLVKQQPDFPIDRRFTSRAEAKAWGEVFAHASNEIVHDLGKALTPPDWQSPS